MNDEIVRIDCNIFGNQLDAHLDGELDAAKSDEMLKHAQNCAACADKLFISARMLDCMRGMDDDISVPLGARTAWRRAVKKEIANKKRRGYTRAFAGVAAALVCLFGTTVLFRQTGLLDADKPAIANLDAPTYFAQADASDKRIASGAAREPRMALKTSAMGASMVVQADGDDIAEDTGANNGKARSMDGLNTGMQGASASDMTDVILPPDDSGAGIESFDTMTDAKLSDMRVYSAERVVETEAFDRERQALEDITEEYGGYFAKDSVDQNGPLRVAYSLIRVPAEDFGAFITALDNIGRTLTYSQVSDEVSEYYYDAQSRLDSERLIVERLNTLIQSADGETLISLNAQLENAYNAIDDLEKLISAYESDVRYSEVALTLKEVSPLPTVTPEPSLGERSASGFKQSLSSIGKFFGDMVVSMSIIAPAAGILIALALIVGGVICVVKKKKGKNDAAQAAREGFGENA